MEADNFEQISKNKQLCRNDLAWAISVQKMFCQQCIKDEMQCTKDEIVTFVQGNCQVILLVKID